MTFFRRNLPAWERLLRLAAAVALAAFAWSQPFGSWPVWLAWAAVPVLAISAVAGFCPACALFGRRLPGKRS